MLVVLLKEEALSICANWIFTGSLKNVFHCAVFIKRMKRRLLVALLDVDFLLTFVARVLNWMECYLNFSNLNLVSDKDRQGSDLSL